jgi:hypothetical protein
MVMGEKCMMCVALLVYAVQGKKSRLIVNELFFEIITVYH